MSETSKKYDKNQEKNQFYDKKIRKTLKNRCQSEKISKIRSGNPVERKQTIFPKFSAFANN